MFRKAIHGDPSVMMIRFNSLRSRTPGRGFDVKLEAYSSGLKSSQCCRNLKSNQYKYFANEINSCTLKNESRGFLLCDIEENIKYKISRMLGINRLNHIKPTFELKSCILTIHKHKINYAFIHATCILFCYFFSPKCVSAAKIY